MPGRRPLCAIAASQHVERLPPLEKLCLTCRRGLQLAAVATSWLSLFFRPIHGVLNISTALALTQGARGGACRSLPGLLRRCRIEKIGGEYACLRAPQIVLQEALLKEECMAHVDRCSALFIGDGPTGQ